MVEGQLKEGEGEAYRGILHTNSKVHANPITGDCFYLSISSRSRVVKFWRSLLTTQPLGFILATVRKEETAMTKEQSKRIQQSILRTRPVHPG